MAEVRLAFSATDLHDHFLATLQPTDFVVVDQDLVVRDFSSFTRSHYSQLDIAVLVDASQSTSRQFPVEAANTIQLISRTPGIPDDSFSIVAFHDLKPALLCSGNCRNLSVEARLPAVRSGGFTPLYDSIVFAARRLGQDSRPDVRRTLILFSDGADTISLASYSDALMAALANGVAIYSVDVSPRPHTAPGTLALRALADGTGGRYFPIEAGNDTVIDAVLEDFHAAYVVTYKLPSRAAGFHSVRLLPTHDLGLQFHCRRGYYFPNQY